MNMGKIQTRIVKVILFLLYIEIFLRCGGALFTLAQEGVNRLKASKVNDIVVVCFGDSMTVYGNYPAELEKILNKLQNKRRFVVVNKGMPMAMTQNTAYTVSDYINHNKVDIAILMSGIEDEMESRKGSYADIRKELAAQETSNSFGRQLISGLLKPKFIIGEIVNNQFNKIRNEEIKFYEKNLAYFGRFIGTRLHPQDYYSWFLFGFNALKLKKYDVADYAFEKMIKCPNFDGDYARIIRGYFANDDYEHVTKWINFSLKKLDRTRVREVIGIFIQKNYKVTEPWIDFALEAHHLSPEIFRDSINVYFQNEEYDKVERWADIWITNYSLKNLDQSLVPKIYDVYLKKGRRLQAEKMVELLMKPKSDYNLWILFGDILKEHKRYKEAEQAYRYAASQVNRIEIWNEIYKKLGELYIDQNRVTDAFKMEKMIKALPVEDVYYQAIQDIVLEKNISFMAMQYPSWDIEDLKRKFRPDKRTQFIDNKDLFSDIGKTHSYYYYYVDHITNSFGHFTAHGAKKIARHVAETILRAQGLSFSE